MSTTTYIGILLFDRTPFNSSLTTAKRLKKKQQQQPKTKNLADLWKRKKKEKTTTINFRHDGLNCQSSKYFFRKNVIIYQELFCCK